MWVLTRIPVRDPATNDIYCSRLTSLGFLSSRSPTNREWRR
jgi:hypothetical protein